jgi:chromosome segregation ATPase
MATPGKKAPCSTCGKERGGVRCEGCSKIFCLNHFDGHRQELSKQLDELEVTRDFFRQTLTDKIAEPQKHALTEQINEWEYQSINKIRQAAEEARQILLKHTAELNTKLEDQLNNLTKQLRQSREEKDFHETDIDQWREELTGMANELAEPSSITIRQDPTSLVTKITVEISGKRF